MLHRVRLMFLTAVLVLFATFPAISAPVNDGAQGLVDTSLGVNGSFNFVGIVPASINYNDPALVGACPTPVLASVSVISFYIDSGKSADTARERQRV